MVSWLTTGIRCARAAPRTTPITKAPAIPNADTLSVFRSPSRSSSWFSETNAQRSYAARIMAATEERPPRGGRSWSSCGRGLRAHRGHVRRARRCVGHILVRPQNVAREVRHEPWGDVVAQNRQEEILPLHDV